MHVAEFEYPQITGARAVLESFLNDQLSDCVLPINGHRYRLKLSGRDQKTKGTVVKLRCVLAAHPVVIQLETQSLGKCLPDGLSFEDLNQLPEDLRLACLQTVFDDTFTEISQKLNDDCSLQALHSAAEEMGEHAIAFTLSNHDSLIPGILNLSSEAMSWFAELCQQHGSEGRGASSPDDLPIFLHLEVAQTTLSENQLRSLEKDDVVLFSSNSWPDGQLLVRAGQLYFKAQLNEEGGLICQEKLSATNDEDAAGEQENLERSQESGRRQSEENAKEGTSFVIRFEFSPQKINLEDLQRLKPGQCITLAPCSFDSILAHLGDRVIARCELVHVQDHRGARIISVVKGEETDAHEGAAQP